MSKSKSKKGIVIVLVILAVLIAGAAAFFLLSGNKITPYLLLGKLNNAQEMTADVTISTDFGGNTMTVDASAMRHEIDGQSYTKLDVYGTSVYCTEDLIVLENGTAYRTGDLISNYASLITDLLPICKNAKYQVEKEDGLSTYSITVDEENAVALMALLFTDPDRQPAQISSFVITITDSGRNLPSQMSLKAAGTLKDATDFACTIELSDIKDSAGFSLPDAVAAALENADTADLPVLTTDLLRLAGAASQFLASDSFAANIVLTADCGLIDLNQKADLYCQTANEGKIYTVDYKGATFYFNENGIVDARGTGLSDSDESGMTNYAQLLDTICRLCLKGNFSVTSSDTSYTYQMDLEGDVLEEIFGLAVPQAEDLNLSCESGSLSATVDAESGKLTGLSLECDGNVKIIIISSAISARVDIYFSDETPEALPDAVVEALDK